MNDKETLAAAGSRVLLSPKAEEDGDVPEDTPANESCASMAEGKDVNLEDSAAEGATQDVVRRPTDVLDRRNDENFKGHAAEGRMEGETREDSVTDNESFSSHRFDRVTGLQLSRTESTMADLAMPPTEVRRSLTPQAIQA